MKLYLSEFSIKSNSEPRPFYKDATQAVLLCCKVQSVQCWRSNDFTDYVEIEERIRSSEVFVALIDTYWISSTWKGHEFTYALGGMSRIDGARGKQISKIIAVMCDGEAFPTYLQGSPKPIIVVHSIIELIEELNLVLTTA